MLLSRIFTVLAATMLVVTFGLIMLTPYDMPLLQGLAAYDAGLAAHIHDTIAETLGSRVWTIAFKPLLDRPIWLIPLSLGMVCVGVATTTNVPPATQRTRRRS